MLVVSQRLKKLRDTVKTALKLIALFWTIDRWLFSLNVVAIFTTAVIPFLTAYIFKLLIDKIILVISGAPADRWLFIALLMSGLTMFVIQSIALSVENHIGRLLQVKVPLSLYQRVLSKLSKLDVAHFEDSNFKNTLERVRDSYASRPLNMLYSLFSVLQSMIRIAVATILLALLNPFLAVLIFVVTIPEFIIRAKQSYTSWDIWRNHSPARKRFWYILDLLQNTESVKELKIFQLPPWFLSETKSIQEKFYQENKAFLSKYFGINTVFNTLEGVMFIAVLTYIILEAIAKRITVGDVSYYVAAISILQGSGGGFIKDLVRLYEDSLYVSSLFEVFDAKPRIQQIPRSVRINLKLPPLIEFENVSFAYPGSHKKVLKNFSLTIRPGEKIALVGENGAGKTTIVKLLARFYDVTDGAILINGINIKELDLETWYRNLGVLFQDFVRYEYPAKKNIHFGKIFQKEKLKEIVDAAVLSGADPTIRKLKNQYDQMLGTLFEEGAELSTGEWQKIALARGFLRDGWVIILDEPAASLDPKSEFDIFKRVEKLSRDKTVITISHRFSTVRNADRICVFKNGSIVESGSHTDLLSLGGTYAKLFAMQAKRYM